ncbi:hypothetical protein BELL_0349g00020 [Botrytis elliptica]|uniref:Uncharacterized protein n=1 Tax=Botrytis elliptica TaxID=278938 RepID=A0A4Z1JJB2_9HELO|nr:hypothetical protein BELL_0349g00020 [Botrytis elliptica]
MTTWFSTHGIGAIKDSSSTFVMNMMGSSVIVKPTTPDPLTGWVHFATPSPSVDNPDLKNLSIKFYSHSAAAEIM